MSINFKEFHPSLNAVPVPSKEAGRKRDLKTGCFTTWICCITLVFSFITLFLILKFIFLTLYHLSIYLCNYEKHSHFQTADGWLMHVFLHHTNYLSLNQLFSVPGVSPHMSNTRLRLLTAAAAAKW